MGRQVKGTRRFEGKTFPLQRYKHSPNQAALHPRKRESSHLVTFYIS